MHEPEVFGVEAFVGDGLQGNLAGVVLLAAPVPDSIPQRVAREFAASETAFILMRGRQAGIRWFTPEVEVDLCGHATLAAAFWLWSTGVVPLRESIDFDSRSGRLRCTRAEDGAIEMEFPALPCSEAKPEPGLLDALGLGTAVFVGRSGNYFLIEVGDEATVGSLDPDLEALRALSCDGAFVTAPAINGKYDFVSRCFFPKEGIPEDPVTGSAHCSLGPYWAARMGKNSLLARQASREMKLLVHPSAVFPLRIGGQVVPDRVSQSVLAFIFLYFQTIAILTFVMLLTGMDFVTALSSIVASVNNMGPALGPTGAAGTFQVLTDLQTWICSLAMLLGRLEIFSVLVLFTPAFWRK